MLFSSLCGRFKPNNYEKNILTLVAASLLSLIGSAAFAQTSVGLFEGGRGYLQRLDGADKNTAPGATVFGLTVEHNVRLNSLFGISAGADVSVSGAKDFMDVKEFTLVESYLDIPLRGKIYLPLGNALDLNFFAGAVPSYCLGSWSKVGDGDTENYFDANKDYKRFDVMLGGGVGLDIIKHIKVAVSFDCGVLDRDGADGSKFNSGILKMTAAYIF